MSKIDKAEAAKHKEKMQRQKEKVDANIAKSNIERGVSILLTGNGKGKTSSAFGMVFRALGYGQQVGVVQFIKGAQDCGEVNYLKANCPEVELYRMGTGFTWNTQDKQADIDASERTWAVAERMLKDDSYDLVVLDELTYMLGYKYLDKDIVINAITSRPYEQSVVVTGRGGGSELREAVDTVAEINDVKHAYKNGVKARKGVDY
ncbi:MAG: cob(I)yrinic acid a,c-diamide adenosyltransferase [Pseudomonadota bacterium]